MQQQSQTDSSETRPPS